jgi:hypothetical protein
MESGSGRTVKFSTPWKNFFHTVENPDSLPRRHRPRVRRQSAAAFSRARLRSSARMFRVLTSVAT